MTLDGLLTSAIVWIRNRQYKRWARNAEAVGDAAWREKADKAERDMHRRSDAARKGWVTRRANAAKRSENGVAGAASSDAAGGRPTVVSPAPQPATWIPAEPMTDDERLALQRIDCGWLRDDDDDCN